MKDSSVTHVLDEISFVQLVDSMGDDLSVVRNARQSFNAEWRTGEDAGKDEKLIRYLMKNRHTSPFEAVEFSFQIKCPIFIARQWHRHRTWSYNEVSARYTELPEEFYVPNYLEIGKQSKTNKQAREFPPEGESAADWIPYCEAIRQHSANQFELYHSLLAAGMPRELARMVLPLNTYTVFSAKVDLHNLFHFLRLRMDSHAQWEMQRYAKAIYGLIYRIVPVSCQAFMETL